jgi:hypothetical protein
MDGAGGRFHYSRQERLSRPGAPRRVPAARGGLLRNRPLLVLLANVALVILLAALLRALLPGPPHEGTLDGFSLRLQAAPRGEAVSVSLFVHRTGAEAMQKPSPQTAHASSFRAERGASAKQNRAGQEPRLAVLQDAGQRIFVRFSLYPGEAESFDSAGLPRLRDQPVILRGTLLRAGVPPGGGEEEVRAEIRIGDQTLLLRRKLPAPG